MKKVRIYLEYMPLYISFSTIKSLPSHILDILVINYGDMGIMGERDLSEGAQLKETGDMVDSERDGK